MKKLLLLLAFFPLLLQAQSIKAKLGTGGAFDVLNAGIGANELVKLRILETGEVRWFLDGQDLFIRDGSFDAFGDGTLYKYDFMHIDGVTGRIGFNILGGHSDGSQGGENDLPLTSSVTLIGSVAYRVRTVNFSSASTTYTVQQDDNILMLNKADNTRCEIFLSPVANSAGRVYTLKRDATSAGDIWVHPQSGQDLNGETDKEIKLDKDNSSLQLVCDGTGWWVLSEVSTNAPSSSITTNTNTSLTSGDFINVNFTSTNQNINLTLPAAAEYEGQRYEIKRNVDGTIFSGNVLKIVPASGENLDQSTSASPYLLEEDFESVTVQSNGTRWLIVNKYKPENAIREVSATSTISSSDKTLLILSTSTINLTLPDITTVPVGKTITVKRKPGAGTGVVTLLTSGAATVEGVASLTIDGTTLSTVTVQSDGLAWWVISKF